MKIVGRLRKSISDLEYRKKIMVAILVFTLVPIIMLGPFYLINVWNSKVGDILGENRLELGSGISRIHDLFNQNIQKVNSVVTASQLGLILTGGYNGDMEDTLAEYMNLKDIFDALNYDMQGDGHGIVVYAFNPQVMEGDYISNANNLDADIRKDVASVSDMQIIWKYRTIKDLYTNGTGKNFICLYKKVFTLDEDLGIAEIRIPFEKIVSNLDFTIPSGSFIVYVTNGGSDRVIVQSNKADSAAAQKAENEYFKTGKTGSYYSIEQQVFPGVVSDKAVMFIPKARVIGSMTGFIIIALLLICLFVTLAYLLVRVVSAILTRQLSMLIHKTNRNIEKLITSEEVTIVGMKGNDEFSVIDGRMNQLIQQIKDYYRKTLESEMVKKSLEVDLLQALINPHFLYNSLSSIKYAYKDKKLWDLVDSMVKYYRIVLSKGEKVFTVSRELELIREYVSIQKFANDTDFDFRADVGEISDCLIIKNLLQPVVENAFLHGISGMGMEGVISISGRLADGKAVIEVSDNGAGIEAEELEKVMSGENLDLQGGYGIKNIQKRIKTHYGEEYGMSIRSVMDEGTTVTITLPALFKPEAAEKLKSS